jgi:AcrR family transcriptional regulator
MKDHIDALFSSRQADIIRAVLKLADQIGIGKLTTKRIAAEVGFAEGALYRHIRSKDEVFDLIIEMVRRMVAEKSRELEGQTHEASKLRGFFTYALEFLEQYPGIYHIIFSDAHYDHSEKHFDQFKTLIFDIQHLVAGIIHRGQEQGTFTRRFDSEDLALNYLGTIHTAFTLWNVFNRRQQTLPQTARPFIEQYMYLLNPEVTP